MGEDLGTTSDADDEKTGRIGIERPGVADLSGLKTTTSWDVIPAGLSINRMPSMVHLRCIKQKKTKLDLVFFRRF
jgi:hypothetical protein